MTEYDMIIPYRDTDGDARLSNSMSRHGNVVSLETLLKLSMCIVTIGLLLGTLWTGFVNLGSFYSLEATSLEIEQLNSRQVEQDKRLH